jgi:hypothetical protein
MHHPILSFASGALGQTALRRAEAELSRARVPRRRCRNGVALRVDLRPHRKRVTHRIVVRSLISALLDSLTDSDLSSFFLLTVFLKELTGNIYKKQI